MKFDEAVNRFGAAVAGSAGVEVREESLPPPLQRAAEAGDLGDRASRERGEDLLGDLAALGGLGVPVGGAELLGARPGEPDLEVSFISGDRGLEPLSAYDLTCRSAYDLTCRSVFGESLSVSP